MFETDRPATETAAESSTELTDLLRGPGGDESANDQSQAQADTVTLEEEHQQGSDPALEAPEEGAEADGQGEESGFTLNEGDRDYSAATYQRAAEHYSKLYGMELDVNNPAHSKLLHDLIARNDKSESTEEAPAEGKEDAGEEAEETAEDGQEEGRQAVEVTPEQRLENAYRWGRSTFHPKIGGEIAQRFSNLMARMMYPGEKFDPVTVDPKLAAEWTETTMAAIGLAVGELMPVIMKSVPSAVKSGFPGFSNVMDLGIREAAMTQVGEMTDVKGNLLFPHLEEVAESGALKKAMKDIKGTFHKDPVKNLVEKVKIAYRLSANSRPNPNRLAAAARAGASSREAAQRREASGRMRPGNSRGAFGTGSKDPADQLLEGMQGASRDRFGEAVRAATKK